MIIERVKLMEVIDRFRSEWWSYSEWVTQGYALWIKQNFVVLCSFSISLLLFLKVTQNFQIHFGQKEPVPSLIK